MYYIFFFAFRVRDNVISVAVFFMGFHIFLSFPLHFCCVFFCLFYCDLMTTHKNIPFYSHNDTRTQTPDINLNFYHILFNFFSSFVLVSYCCCYYNYIIAVVVVLVLLCHRTATPNVCTYTYSRWSLRLFISLVKCAI